MEQAESKPKGAFAMLKECKKCGHTLLDHSSRPNAGSEPQVGACKECDCQQFEE